MKGSDKTFSHAIAWMMRRSRMKAGKSRKEIAVALSISLNRVVRIERGMAEVGAIEWFLFCQEIGICSDSIQMGYISWKGTMEFHHEEMRAAKKEIPHFFEQRSLPPIKSNYVGVRPGLRFSDPSAFSDIDAESEPNKNA